MPKICCIDLKQSDLDVINDKFDDVFVGTLGNILTIGYKRQYDKHPLLLGFEFPENLHEYDVLLIDLGNKTIIDYDKQVQDDITRRGTNREVLVCRYPQNQFDPRPLSSSILKYRIWETNKNMIIVIFASNDYEEKYHIADDISELDHTTDQTYKLCDIIWGVNSEAHSGTKVSFCDELKNSKFCDIISKYTSDLRYESAFDMPTQYDDQEKKNIILSNYFPILQSNVGEIVSFAAQYDNKMFYILPHFNLKGKLIVDLMDNYFPATHPDLFPESTLNAWLDIEVYNVPKHKTLLNNKQDLMREYETKIQKANDEISNNLQLHSWLHDLITKDGDELKLAVIKYLEYIQFDKVRDMDAQGIKDEDIQIITGNKLIITEVKGLGGTSNDANILQVTKHLPKRIRQFREREVSALYIVNHQKHLEPLKRVFNPFEERQLDLVDERDLGMVTTWQLFLTYKYLEEGVFSKSDIREQITNHSFITFMPLENYQEFRVSKVYKDKAVASIDIVDFEVSIGQDIVIFNDHFIMDKARIISIQKGNNQVETISNGKIGIVCGLPFTEGKSIFLRKA